MHALLTDLYEITMAAGYFESGKTADHATFELSIRRLPEHRSFVLAAGVEQAIDYLLDLRFTDEEIAYLRGLPNFARASGRFWEYLAGFRFTGDAWAVEEGTPLFPDEPVMRISAPLAEAQIPETYLLATISFQTLIATKAARVVSAAQGRPIVEFGTRRAHTPQAGTLGARAAFIGGCVGTSNVESGYRFGIPVYGTAAHSWTLAYDSEPEAFARLQEMLGEHAIYLVDTYDVEAGVRNAAGVGRPFWGIRLDSGNFLADSRMARRILDEAGWTGARIMASGDLDEYSISELVAAGAPIDSFGVGTELATSRDAPALGSIYKLVEIESDGHVRATAKFSAEKPSLPGVKQVFRFADHDVLALASESLTGGVPLLAPVIQAGKRIAQQPDLHRLRETSRQKLAAIPESCRRLRDPQKYPVRQSQRLQALTKEVRELEMGTEESGARRRE